MKRQLLAGSLLFFMNPSFAADATSEKVLDLVRQQAEAQRLFDVNKLKDLTAENYIEVSPRGEVDPREKMLGFYAPSNKVEAPVMKIEEPQVRILGDTAIVISRLNFSMNAQGKTQNFSMRATHVAQKIGTAWKLVSAHYSNIK